MNDKSRNERGAAAIIAAITLLALLGFTALAIDAGVGYNDRRGTQNAADLAALAAAWEDCNPQSGSPDSEAAALQTAADNGYDDSDPDIEVVPTDLGGGQWQVDIRITNETIFGRAIPNAGDQITVISSAVAECERIPFLGGYAVFAGGPPSCTGGAELDLSGSSKIVNGGVHSNGQLKISGSETAINGQVTFVSSSNYEPSQQLSTSLEYPLDVRIEHYRPGGSRRAVHQSNGQFFETDSLTSNWLRTNGYAANVGGNLQMQVSGVYYTTGDIHINDNIVMAPGVRVTWVSEGKIRFTGNVELYGFDPVVGGPNDPGIAIFANHRPPGQCSGQAAISLKGANTVWTGVLFAPYGPVEPSFSSNVSLNGSIVGYTLAVSGANFEISWQDNPNALPDFRVNLLK